MNQPNATTNKFLKLNSNVLPLAEVVFDVY